MLADTAVSWEVEAAGQQDGAAADKGAEAAAAGCAIGQCTPRSSSSSLGGWRSLRLLDLRGSHLTGAGCQQLVSELQATARAAATELASGGSSACSAGLQALLVGGRHHKLGSRAVAAISALATLKQLTLQVWRCGGLARLWFKRVAHVPCARMLNAFQSTSPPAA